MDVTSIQPNDLAGLAIAEAMVAYGVTDIVLSPGSRSTPFTYAFSAEDRLQKHLIIDERSAGFFALGIAKRTGNPVLLVCTSGSAVANYLPAVVEARYSRTPLIILSADRPIHQWECHAGQTIKQSGIFSAFVNWETEIAEPKSSLQYLRYLREKFKHAIRCSKSPSPGVVHLNAPLCDPLTPTLFGEDRNRVALEIQKVFSNDLIKTSSFPPTPSEVFDSNSLSYCRRILILVGQVYDSLTSGLFSAIREIQEKSGAVILADALNPIRNLRDDISVVSNYDFLLRAQDASQVLNPDLIIQIGNLPTSKVLRSIMEKWDSPLIQVGSNHDNQDPTFSNKVACVENLSQMIPLLGANINPNKKWSECWDARDQEIGSLIDREIGNSAHETESHLCKSLPDFLNENVRLMISNSMIVRDMDAFWAGSSKVEQMISNRGANGIDGIVSTAFGVAKDPSSLPTLCVVGDLAFLHDAGSLVLNNQLEEGQKLVFVLLDNNGGGIFEHLSISKLNPPFEEYFATPQKVEVEPLCNAYGINYVSPDSITELGAILTSYFESSEAGALCVHFHFDRKTSYGFRKRIASKIHDLLKENYELTVD